QLQVIVELRHRADRRARSPHRIGLVDGDRRRNAIDALDLRAVHAIEKLPRVRRERLDVTALPFRINRVEHERGLARARHAGDDDQLVRRQLEIEVLEIVLACAADDDGMGHFKETGTGKTRGTSIRRGGRIEYQKSVTSCLVFTWEGELP